MKKFAALLGVTSLLIASSAFALSLELVNKSAWEIHELYFSDVDEEKWGPDQLGDEMIEPKASFKLMKISKGTYDVKIVDEDGDSCEVEDVDFTSSERFELTDEILLGCQAATEADNEEN